MRGVLVIITAVVLTIACGQSKERDQAVQPKRNFHTDVLLKHTPMKDQGNSELCWAYAMLATIESEHMMQGDSIELSADHLAYMFLLEQSMRRYGDNTKGGCTTRGVTPMALRLMRRYGCEPLSTFRSYDSIDYSALCRKLDVMVEGMTNQTRGAGQVREAVEEQLQETMGPLPRFVFMYSCEYTPLEFAHSVLREQEYVTFGSWSHHPYGSEYIIESPDNLYSECAINVPLDSLQHLVDHALATGHAVCWEGDISEPGFSFEEGVATIDIDTKDATQGRRQRDFDRHATTDDHCMTIVGKAHDDNGQRYYIAKNSWGKDNPFGGFMFISEAFLRMKTINIVVSQKVLNP
jgi:bleomycin hydrolase